MTSRFNETYNLIDVWLNNKGFNETVHKTLIESEQPQ